MVSPINLRLFDNLVQQVQLDYYTKKLFMKSFVSLLLHAQPQETESLHAISDDLRRARAINWITFHKHFAMK